MDPNLLAQAGVGGAMDPNVLAMLMQQMQAQQAPGQQAPPLMPPFVGHQAPPLAPQPFGQAMPFGSAPPGLGGMRPPMSAAPALAMPPHGSALPPVLQMGLRPPAAAPQLQMPDPIIAAHLQQAARRQAAAAQAAAPPVKECHLHKKPNKKCKFCLRVLEAQASASEAKSAAASGVGPGGRAQMPNQVAQDPVKAVTVSTWGMPPILQSHILGSAHYKESLTLETFDQIVGEMREYGDSIEPYLANSNATPSALFCCLYRLVTFGIDSTQLSYLLDLDDHPRIRCVGLLYVRFGLPPDQLWQWLGDYALDDQELQMNTASADLTTIGEFVENLLLEESYHKMVLPRLPMSVKRQLQAKLAPVPQYRQRAQANLDFLDAYRDGRITVEINRDGKWIEGTAQALLEHNPSRVKVVVRVADDEAEVDVPLGKVILTDPSVTKSRPSKAGRSGRSGRSRSRSTGKNSLARERGRPDQDLIDELRSKDRDKATTSGKVYARRILGYKASCAMPQEQGAASTRLCEEETFVSDRGGSNNRRRSPSPPKPTERISDERKAQMQQLFEKYGMQKPTQSQASGKDEEALPSFLRFG